MPPLTDKGAIRAILQRDRRWCVYALGDLTPRMFAKCQWFAPDLTLVLHDYGTSILFADGIGSIREALDHVSWPVHLQVHQDALDEIKRYAIVTGEKQMIRMAADGTESNTRAAESTESNTRAAEGTESNTRAAEGTEGIDRRNARRLTSDDIESLKRLYSDGAATGESPDFFYDSMVTDGVFFGVEDQGELVAAAGTHLVARDESAAAIGNVYVRRDRRSRGLGKVVTAAVLHELRGFQTVGLNVRADNYAAIRVYESLGFVQHCDFCEGLAMPYPAPPAV